LASKFPRSTIESYNRVGVAQILISIIVVFCVSLPNTVEDRTDQGG
jgi:hypothetical protein